jgi:general secretion pathway protein D
MKILNTLPTRICGLALLASLLVVSQAPAQFFPGGGGGFGGGQRRGNTSSSRTYSANSTVGDAVISIDPETRNLIVIADDETAAYIQQVVANLDAPKPQVLIKVVFLEVSRKDGSDIGIEGTYNKNGNWSGGITNLSGGNLFGLANSGYAPVPPGAGLYQVFAQDYQVTLRAIATAGKVKVLSKPSVIARNNQPATINVGQSVPLITNVRFDNFGNAINSVSYQDVGIILRVTPFITSDGFVEMIISPETSELEQDRSQWVPISTSEQSGTISAPIINTRAADTVVVTPDGQTVIIGGMMANAKGESVYKIPYLGDIPLLGALFRRTTKTDTQTELMIFLTPHIIAAPAQMVGLTQQEAGKYSAPKTLEDKEVEKFLEGLPLKEPPTDPAPNGKKSKSKTDPSGKFEEFP